jgi:glycosyltransferase involved in cell wall biosynthesis
VEDAGIVPLEALACARPAVVFGEGGGAESIEHGRTGLVFREPTAAALRAAVANLETTRFDRLALRARAEALRLEVFEERVRSFVADALGRGEPGC